MKNLMKFDIYYIINLPDHYHCFIHQLFHSRLYKFVIYINQLFLPFPLFPYKALTPAVFP